VRNVGKAEVTVTYGILRECAPQVSTDAGGRVSVFMPPSFRGYAVPTKRTLKPGETITLYNPEVAVESEALTRLEGFPRQRVRKTRWGNGSRNLTRLLAEAP
jgi:hypothetical protein